MGYGVDRKRAVCSRSWVIVLLVLSALLVVACSSGNQAAQNNQSSTSGEATTGNTVQQQPAETFTFKYHHSYPPTLAFYRLTGGGFIDLAERWSGGQLQFEVYEANALVSPNDMLEAASTGVIDISQSWGGYYVGEFPEGDIEVGLPLAWREPWEAYDAYYNRGLYEIFERLYRERFNVKFFPLVMGMQYAISTTVPVTSLDDLQGLKIRALGMYGRFVEKLGASPTVIAGPELYSALQLGTMDGLVYDAEANLAQNLTEFLKSSIVNPNLNVGVGHLVMNMDKWESLPPHLQQVIEDVVQYGNAYHANLYRIDAELSLGRAAEEYGVQLVTLSDADEQRALQAAMELWDEVATVSDEARQAVDIVKEQLRDYGRLN